jgi:predicted ATP-grasp superfamily ATP-dependent carboligase
MGSGAAIPAVVVGLELNGLGAARSLAKGGVPVIGLDVDPACPGARSRSLRARRISTFGGEPLVLDLLALARELGCRPVLFVTKEETVATLSAERDRLAAAFSFVLPPASLVASLTDKRGFHQAALATGAPVPATLELATLADLDQARTLRFPCVLKPNAHIQAYQARFRKAYKVADLAALDRLYAEIHPVHPHMVVQEWIEGDDGDIYFCLQYRDAEGHRLASFTGRKIRSWPPETGGTASCTAAPEAAAELQRLTDAFFDATGCVGMAGMEFKRDRASGRFLMVEPTVGRTDHQAEIATLNGVNLPLVAYRSLAGGPAPRPAAPARARIWRDPVADLMAARSREGGSQARPAMPPGRVVDAWFRVGDPLPWLAIQMQKLGRRMRPARSSRRIPAASLEP